MLGNTFRHWEPLDLSFDVTSPKNSSFFKNWAAVSAEGFLNMSGVFTFGVIASVGELWITSRWISMLSLVFDSVLFQIFLAHPTVPRVQRSPTSSQITSIYFFTHICEPSITNQCYLGTIVPCSAGNRISRGGPPTSAWNYSLFPTSATPKRKKYLLLLRPYCTFSSSKY